MSTGRDDIDLLAVDTLLWRLWRTQFIAAAIIGIACVLLAILIARLLTYSDLEELKRMITDNKCECHAQTVRSDASGNSLWVLPDQNSYGQLTRDVLKKQGFIDGGLRDSSGGPGDSEQ